MILPFKLGVFKFRLAARDPLRLPPYKGSTLRGGFGTAFKKVVCAIRTKDCLQCLLKEKCVYSYIFETPPPKDSEILRKYEKAPHPFIIEPPLEDKTEYTPGDSLDFHLVLIGKALDYLPYFIYTFEELGTMGIGKGRGKFELLEVRHGDRTIYQSTDKKLQSIPDSDFSSSSVFNGQNGSGDFHGLDNFSGDPSLSLNFLTPTRMIVDGKLVTEPDFHHLARTLLRRISTLSYFHCDKRLDLDFKGLIEKAGKVETRDRVTTWHDWERYSARQDTKMKMGGFVGRVSFKGELEDFMPFIRLGRILHVGKGTSFGLGKYEIV